MSEQMKNMDDLKTIGRVITRVNLFDITTIADMQTSVNQFLEDLEKANKRYQIDNFQLLKSNSSYIGILTIKFMV